MKTLCAITPWKKKVATKGRGAGKEQETRYVVAVDLWNWIIAEEQKGRKQIVGEHFFGSIRSLIIGISQILPKIDQIQLLKSISRELTNLTGTDFKFDSKLKPKAIAILIDQTFNTSFHKQPYPPEIYKNLFREESNENIGTETPAT